MTSDGKVESFNVLASDVTAVEVNGALIANRLSFVVVDLIDSADALYNSNGDGPFETCIDELVVFND